MAQPPTHPPPAGKTSPVVDEPPGRDGYQSQNPNRDPAPVPDYPPGTNPPGTNPPVAAAHDPALTPIPGMLPGVPLDDYPHAKKPKNEGEDVRAKETPTRGGPPR